MSGVSVVPYTLAPAAGAGAKPSKKRKKRSKSSASDAKASMVDGGWSKVDIEDMQLEGFQDGCAFELEELTDYHVESAEDGGKVLIGDDKKKQETDGGKKKRRRKTKTKTKTDTEDADVREEKEVVKQEKRDDEEDAPKKTKKKTKRGGKAAKRKEEAVDTVDMKDVHLPKWNKYKLHPLLMQSLQTCDFSAPT
uniref:Uncharacterized protein n=2 Tax=Phytophthora ramorum TaxID=164328 RepID=H3H6T0_PHYRM